MKLSENPQPGGEARWEGGEKEILEKALIRLLTNKINRREQKKKRVKCRFTSPGRERSADENSEHTRSEINLDPKNEGARRNTEWGQ